MAFDEGLAERVRVLAADRMGITEQKMFGGLCVMVDGNMGVGVLGSELLVRVGKDSFEELVALPHARVFDLTGRPSTGMVYVAERGVAEDDDLATWVERGLAYAASLPPK